MIGPKIGLITTMSQDTTWPDSMIDKVLSDQRQAHEALCAMGFDVVLGSEGLSRTKEQMRASAGRVAADGVQALVLYVGCWTYANVAVELASIVDVPILIWTNSGNGNIGIVGAAVAKGSLDEVGYKKTALVHGDFDCPRTLQKIKVWCTGVSAAMRLRGSTLGVGGARCMGMYTATVDPSQIKRQFGVDIDGWEQIELVEKAKAMDDAPAYEYLSWMKTEYGGITAKEEAVIAQIKMYLALRQMIKEKGYDFVSVKCLPELPSIHTTFCLAHATLNDASDAFGEKEPFICSCEADINGALTMQMMKNITGQPVMFADFLSYEEEDSLVTLCNCGSQPTHFAPSRKDVIWVHEGLVEFVWKIGGCNPQYVAGEGAVTLARLGRIGGEFIMLIMTGEIQTRPRECLKIVNEFQPQAFVRLNVSRDDFEANLRSNHIHMGYGLFVQELVVLCETLNIRPIVI